jgi:PPOX class probable FMN-dependent enzyme
MLDRAVPATGVTKRSTAMEECQTAFDNRFTRAFGVPLERIQTKVKGYLPEPVKAFIAESPFLVMSTSDRQGRCDASPKGGEPGFVRILDDRHLLLPDVAGNKLFQSYLNMNENPHVGLVFFIPGISEVVRVNGRVTIVGREDLDRHQVERSMYNPDGNRAVQQGILIEVEEAYTHCPRAASYSRIWDEEEIRRRKQSGRHPLRGAAVPAGAPARR